MRNKSDIDGTICDTQEVEGLGKFQHLRELVISRPDQETIEEIGRLQNLELLYIVDTRAKDLSPLIRCRSLRHLTVKGAIRPGWKIFCAPLEDFGTTTTKRVQILNHDHGR